MSHKLRAGIHATRGVEAFIEELALRGFSGDLATDEANRTVYATDNSIYRVPPRAVVFPRDARDVGLLARLAAEPCFRSLPLAPRGGGTGTNGQSLTDGIAVDLSRHMTRILSIDPGRRRARVEAGVVKDQLNAELRPHGLFFAPELSTSNRATIGGMVNTDASGQGSCLYGKTRDHVLALTTVLTDGTTWTSCPLEEDELRQVRRRPDLVGEVHRVVDALHRRDGALFVARVPTLNRNVTGYDLAHVRDEAGRFDLNSVLCGSEGTLGFVVEVELNLLPVPARAVLLNVHYPTFDAALRDARELMRSAPASVETVDAKVLDLARGDPVWRSVAPLFPAADARDAFGVNIVEFVGDDATVDAALARCVAALAPRVASGAVIGHSVARGADEVAAIWSMRKKAVGLLGNASGPRRPIPFVEDAAVPPERLADFISAFRAVLDRHGLDYGMFGHVDAGVLHVRPALDMTSRADRALIRTVSDEVATLARAHGGVLWGEHGKGMRSEFAPEIFGPLYPTMQAIKAAFDPDGRLNPGKVASPPRSELLRVDEVPIRGEFEERLPAAVRSGHGNAFHCNGNGLCFDFDADGLMCPSYKGTRDRRHSPKGRAALLREWLVREPPRTSRRASVWSLLAAWPIRALNTVRATWAPPDFSREVKEAMDGCLSCKACVGQCPVKVNVPSFRATFLDAYYSRRLRPLGGVLMGWVEHLLPLAVAARPVYAVATGTVIGRCVLTALGVTALPRMPAEALPRALATRGVRTATPASLAALPDEERARCVVLVVDAFTRSFEPSLVLDVADLMVGLGFLPWISPALPTGKALHVQGLLARFQSVAARTAATLRDLSATGVPLVGIDPAMTLTFRAEYPEALGAASAPDVQLLQEWLSSMLRNDRRPPRSEGDRYALLPHCTEQATTPEAVASWRDVFAAFGLELSILRAGCCGMAGTFGHEVRHRELSARIYDLSWRDKVSAWAGSGRLLASGYSCRSQARLLDGATLPHPAKVLLEELRRGRLVGSAPIPVSTEP